MDKEKKSCLYLLFKREIFQCVWTPENFWEISVPIPFLLSSALCPFSIAKYYAMSRNFFLSCDSHHLGNPTLLTSCTLPGQPPTLFSPGFPLACMQMAATVFPLFHVEKGCTVSQEFRDHALIGCLTVGIVFNSKKLKIIYASLVQPGFY